MSEMNDHDSTTIRPRFVTDEHLVYLDELRESGDTNMFGAASYVAEEFAVSAAESHHILTYWMKSFGSEDR